MKRLLPTTSIVIGIVFILFISGPIGLIDWHYPRRVDNDPLLAPVKVLDVDGNIISLEDGRRFAVTSINASLEAPTLMEAIDASNGEVEVVTYGADVDIFVKNKLWLCGTCRSRGLIKIPLFASEEHANGRNLIGEVSRVRLKQ